MTAEDQRSRNRAVLEDVERRLARVRDKLAAVAAEAGPLYREATELVEELGGLLASSRPPDPEPPGGGTEYE